VDRLRNISCVGTMPLRRIQSETALALILLEQLINKIADLVPEIVLIIQHTGLVEIEFAVGGIFFRVGLKLTGKGERLITSPM
jgi:hypothetical protein